MKNIISYFNVSVIQCVDGKQCGSWSAGFIRSQLIWIYAVFERVYTISKNLSLLGWIQLEAFLFESDWTMGESSNFPQILNFKSLNLLYANKSVIISK